MTTSLLVYFEWMVKVHGSGKIIPSMAKGDCKWQTCKRQKNKYRKYWKTWEDDYGRAWKYFLSQKVRERELLKLTDTLWWWREWWGRCWWLVFAERLTDERLSVLNPTRTNVILSYHNKLPARCKQCLNLRRVCIQTLLNKINISLSNYVKDYGHDFTNQDLESTATEEKTFAFDVFIDISSKYSVIQKFF